MVEHTQEAHVFVKSDSSPVVFQKGDCVAQSGGHPASALIKIVRDGLGRVCICVRGGAILDFVALLDKES